MRMHEYQAKALLRGHGVPLPEERLARTVDEALAAGAELGFPVVVKAQVLTGGRGKAGGVRLVTENSGLAEAAAAILGMSIKGERCDAVLVARACTIVRELYAGVTIDPGAGAPVLLLSGTGGVDIEETAGTAPETVRRLVLSPLALPPGHVILEELRLAGITGPALPAAARVAGRLVRVFFDRDCTTLEINPLAVLEDGQCLALDAKAVIDDAALPRQKLEQTDAVPCTENERRAAAIGVHYVALDGHMAVIAGGAGLAMATMDMVRHCGARPASFLDTGGGISSVRMAEALRVSLAGPDVRGVVVNIFGGINNCLEVARGIAEVLDTDRPTAPVVVKMRGHSQDEGWALLEARGVPLVKHGTTREAVRTLLAAAQEAGYGDSSH